MESIGQRIKPRSARSRQPALPVSPARAGRSHRTADRAAQLDGWAKK